MTQRERQVQRRKFWAELIGRQKQSGKTVGAFCQENGVGGPSFYAWRKRLLAEAKGQGQSAISFALVETPGVGRQQQQSGEPVELILSSGDRLRIGPGTDAATLRLVLSILRREEAR